MSHRSTRRRTRVCARFHTESMRRCLRSSKGLLHPDDLATALTYLNVSYERRACPICRAADAGECECTLPFCRPSHPLDFRNEQRNMRLHTGLYQGGCTVQLFNAAMPFVVTNLSTRSIIKGSLDQKVITRLNKYAVQDRMGLLKMRPLSMAIGTPRGICASGPAANGDADDAGPQIVQTSRDCNAVLDVGPPVMLPDASFLQDNGGLKSPSLSSFSFGVPEDGPVPLFAAPLGVGTTLVDNIAPSEVTPSGLTNPSTSHSYNAKSGQGFVSPPEEAESARRETGGQDEGEGLQSQEFVGNSGHAETRSTTEGTDEKTTKGGKELKAELRKKRNRAAAARSNVKRKIRNEALRRDLANINRRAAELRATEKMLRQENVRLRGLATQRNFKVSAHLSHIQIARS